jgi:hypothetical protein
MALLIWEGFDYLSASSAGAAQDLATKPGWSNPGLGVYSKVPGLLGGFAIAANNRTSSKEVTYTFDSAKGMVFAGLRYELNTVAYTLTQDVFRFFDGASVQCGISVTAAGKIIFWRGTNATVLATGVSTLLTGNWYFIEVGVKFSATVGTFEVKLGGISGEIPLTTGQNTITTANAQATAVSMGYSPSANNSIDDFYACDDQGSAPTNTFLGIIQVETLYGVANNSVAWTPNASTNVSQIQEQNMDADTTFNFSTVSGNIDTFTHGPLSSTPVTIFGADIVVANRKTDVSGHEMRTKLISGATTANGATTQLGTAYSRLSTVYLTDPDTSAAWSTSGINNNIIGYEQV